MGISGIKLIDYVDAINELLLSRAISQQGVLTKVVVKFCRKVA